MRIKVLFIILLIVLLTYGKSFSQFNELTNDFSPINQSGKTHTSSFNKTWSSYSSSSLACDSSIFWAINGSGEIHKFILNGNIVVSGGIVDTNGAVVSLAVCNNLNGGPLSPTFYATNYTLSPIMYYNGSSGWTNVSTVYPNSLLNMGGNDYSLYLMSSLITLPCQLIKYDGSSFSLFYSYDSLYFSAADNAVDVDGNIWCFSSTNNPSSSTPICQYIDAISPSGILIKRYNFNFNTYNAYGCFLLDTVLYLGLGSNNPIYPNSLLPISFDNDSAYIGNPIAMPADGWLDLASCLTSLPLSVNKKEIPLEDFKVYPNPSTGELFLKVPAGTAQVQVVNSLGQILKTINAPVDSTLRLEIYRAGIYFIRLVSNKYLDSKKIVVLE